MFRDLASLERPLPLRANSLLSDRWSHRFAAMLCMGLFLAVATGGGSFLAVAQPQGAALQTYPERPTPSQEAVPGLPPQQKRPAPTPPKTEQYTLSQDRYEKAVAYSRAEYVLYFLSYVLSLVVLVLFLKLGVAARFRDLAESVSGNRFLQGLVFVPLLVIALDIFELPLRLYAHSLSLRYEQSIQGWGSWCWDWSKAELLGVGFALMLALILFVVMRWSPRRWWFHFWLASLPILLFVFFISPWFIDPLFNTFEPLDAKYPELTAAMQKVVQQTGLAIPREQMFLMQASKKTNDINAYVTGMGASKRVVVWDTTIQKMTTDETLFIFGHEAGHYVLGHVRNGFLFFAVVLLVALYLGYRGLHWALDRWGKDWKVYGPEDWASLAVLLLLLQVMMFVALPITNGFSRMQEHAADVYGLEVIHGLVPNSAEVAAHAFQVMGEIDLADPNPPQIITFWLYTHPPLAERLVFAHSYDPWSKGRSPKYVKLARE
jgi:STE24 endopeptidase